ncbi:hypothetical protein B0H13DRAFT_1877100 [Mycena leptocephala]|nr:hypothetical protein B0H13DRAFT_1877100 [Mycena leptocephala]
MLRGTGSAMGRSLSTACLAKTLTQWNANVINPISPRLEKGLSNEASQLPEIRTKFGSEKMTAADLRVAHFILLFSRHLLGRQTPVSDVPDAFFNYTHILASTNSLRQSSEQLQPPKCTAHWLGSAEDTATSGTQSSGSRQATYELRPPKVEDFG